MKKILALTLSAAILGAMSMTPASAATALAPSAVDAAAKAASQTAGGVELIKKRRKWRKRRGLRRGRGYRRGFRAGRRYGRAPRGWRRYRGRPRYWRSRGCIIVGPVWFCP